MSTSGRRAGRGRGRLRDPVAAAPGAGGPGVLHGRSVHDRGGQHDHLHRAAVAGPGVPRVPGRRAVGDAELPAQPGCRRPVVRVDRGPVRHPAHLPDRPGAVHRVLRAVRPVRLADPAGHLPVDPGHRRRPDHPGRPGHDVPHLPARAPRPGPGHGRAGHGPRPGHRARAGRDTHHRAVLAVVLLRQYPVRDRRSGHRAAVPVRAPRAGRLAGHRRLRAGRRRPGAVPVRPQRGAGAGLDQPGHRRGRRHQPGRAGRPGACSNCG